MAGKLHLDPLAEREANDIGERFMHSHDVVGDMSCAYGRDLSSVKIHTDEGAAQRAKERGVDAFSTGRDVFFAHGTFDQNDPACRGLLAHEMSHSLQQGAGGAPSMTHAAPMGAKQGGLLDWFRGLFGRRKKPELEPELNISAPLAMERNTSEDSVKYAKAMEPYLRKDRIAHTAVPSPTVGKRAALRRYRRSALRYAAAGGGTTSSAQTRACWAGAATRWSISASARQRMHLPRRRSSCAVTFIRDCPAIIAHCCSIWRTTVSTPRT